MAVKKKPLGKQLEQALHKVGEYYADAVRDKMVNEGLHSSGRLGASIETKIVDGSLDVLQAKYGAAIDEGSRSASAGYQKVSKAFIDNIMEWAQMKGIRPDKGSMKDMAFGIAKTIKRDGLVQRYGNTGAKIFDRVYKELEDRIGTDLMEGYQKDIKNKLNKL